MLNKIFVNDVLFDESVGFTGKLVIETKIWLCILYIYSHTFTHN